MKKIITLLLALFAFTAYAQAQKDKIHRLDNTSVDAKVIRITESTIEYKNPANPEGPTYTIPVSKVGSINYSNGYVETFQSFHEEVPAESQSAQEPVRNEGPDTASPANIPQDYVPSAQPSYEQQYQTPHPSVGDYQTDRRYDGITQRDPVVAFALSFLLPGAGQLYNKEYGKAGIMAGAYVASWILFSSSIQNAVYDIYTGDFIEDGYSAGVYLGIAGIIATELWSMIDAPISAKRINEKLGLSNIKIEPHSTFAFTGDGKTPVFGAKLTIGLN